MKNTWLMTVVALLVLSAGACKRENKAEQLAALDSAYQSGVLSKAEYDAKRLALVGPPPANPPSDTPPAPAPAPPEPAARRPSPAAQTRPAPQSGAREAELEPGPLAGCEDAEYKSGQVKGAQQRFYPASMDAVKTAAGAALSGLDFNIQKDTGNDWEASKRRHIGAIVGAGGERLTLHFENAHQGKQAGTLVTGETKKSFVGRVTQKSWTSAVLAQITCQLRARR